MYIYWKTEKLRILLRKQTFTRGTFSFEDLQIVPISSVSEAAGYGERFMSKYSVCSFRRGLRYGY